jgi:GAF domain-containing protein
VNINAPELSAKHTTIPIPIKIRDEIIGQFLIEAENDTLSNDQIGFIQAISNQTSIALENAHLFSETQRSALQEQLINELTGRFSNILTIEEIIKTAVIEFGKLPSVSEASISVLPPDESSDIKVQNHKANT